MKLKKIFAVTCLATILISIPAFSAWLQDSYGWRYYRYGEALTDCWLDLSGESYYFDDSGYALTGYQEVEGEYYYFLEDCSLAKENVAVFSPVETYYLVDEFDYHVTDVASSYDSAMGSDFLSPEGHHLQIGLLRVGRRTPTTGCWDMLTEDEKNAVTDAIETFKDEYISSDMSDLEKERAIFEWLYENTTYKIS